MKKAIQVQKDIKLKVSNQELSIRIAEKNFQMFLGGQTSSIKKS